MAAAAAAELELDGRGVAFGFLGVRDLCACSAVSRSWHGEADADALWSALLSTLPHAGRLRLGLSQRASAKQRAAALGADVVVGEVELHQLAPASRERLREPMKMRPKGTKIAIKFGADTPPRAARPRRS